MRHASAVRVWMRVGLLAGVLALAIPSAPAAGGATGAGPGADTAPLRFFVVGDLPYSRPEYDQLAGLMAGAVRGGAPFIVHVGDIKGGGQPCTDAGNAEIAALFRAQPVPVLYAPGDNEWTDCHRAGGDPYERLAALRRAFFEDPGVLHDASLAPVVPNPGLPEDRYFLHRGVLFALVHIVGSGNNHRQANAAAMTELRARSAANRALLREATRAALRQGATAMVVIFHANPLFERARPTPGYAPLMEDLAELLAAYAGPVLVIHGDTHRFRFDQPLRYPHTGETAPRLWRLEVPGSPLGGGVWVSVDGHAEEPFRVEVVYPTALDAVDATLTR